MDRAGWAGNWLNEFLVHGYDVARAAGRPWLSEDRDWQIAMSGVTQVAPGWVDRDAARGHDMRVRLAVRRCVPQLFSFTDGVLELRDAVPSDRVDAEVTGSAEPLTLLLFGRISLAGAVRRGVLVTGGRRPWLDLRMPSLFLPI